MPDDLRVQIEAALKPFTYGDTVDAHVGDVLNAVMPIVEKRLERTRNFHMGRCRWCGQLTEAAWRPDKKPRPHDRGCRLYVGPVEHRVRYVRDMLIGQANECLCGRWWRDEEGGCPNSEEDWRGTPPEEAP